MDSSGLIFILCCLLVGISAVTVGRWRDLSSPIGSGIMAWASALPLLAAVAFVGILAVQFFPISMWARKITSIRSVFSQSEIFLLSLMAPLLFTRANSIIAALVAIYGTEKLLFNHKILSGQMLSAPMFLVVSAIIVAALGEFLPWFSRAKNEGLSHKIRDVIVMIVSFVAMATIFAAIIKVGLFGQWFQRVFGMEMSNEFSLAIFISLFAAWITIALGLTRPVGLALVCLPTIAIFAFVSSWPAGALCISFAAFMGLTIAVAAQNLQAAKINLRNDF